MEVAAKGSLGSGKKMFSLENRRNCSQLINNDICFLFYLLIVLAKYSKSMNFKGKDVLHTVHTSLLHEDILTGNVNISLFS
jgi:hypothetical protein